MYWEASRFERGLLGLLLGFLASNVSPEQRELLFDGLVAPVDMIDPPDGGCALGHKPCKDEAGAGSQVGSHDLGSA